MTGSNGHAPAGTGGETQAAGAEPSRAGRAPATPAVADALTLLDTLGERPLSEHPEIYQGAHAHLQRALAEIDDA